MRQFCLIIISCWILISSINSASSDTSPIQIKTVFPQMELIFIPGGEFIMGSDKGDIGEKPAHRVIIKGFWIAPAEVTNFQYCIFLNVCKPWGWDRRQWIAIKNDLENEDRKDWLVAEIYKKDGSYYVVDGFNNYPVVCVSWLGAKAFCDRFNMRLPTEAEWEFAAGGLSHNRYPWGEQWREGECCYGCKSPSNSANPTPVSPVKSYPANSYGLYDMAGNVWEWCADWYDRDYYKGSQVQNPCGPYSGEESQRVLRGGGWNSTRDMICITIRAFGGVGYLFGYNGFRCSSN